MYMAVIFYLSSQPNALPELTRRVSDTLLHGVEYGGLAALFVRALRRHGFEWRAAFAASALLASLYGASDEYHQAFVPGRNSTVSDWIADCVGGVLGATAYTSARHRSRRTVGM